jgi:hypothetical protein
MVNQKSFSKIEKKIEENKIKYRKQQRTIARALSMHDEPRPCPPFVKGDGRQPAVGYLSHSDVVVLWYVVARSQRRCFGAVLL